MQRENHAAQEKSEYNHDRRRQQPGTPAIRTNDKRVVHGGRHNDHVAGIGQHGDEHLEERATAVGNGNLLWEAGVSEGGGEAGG